MPSPVSTNTGKPNLVPSFLLSPGDSPRSVPRVMISPSVVQSAEPSSASNKDGRPSDAPSPEPILAAIPSSIPNGDSLKNEIKALSGRKFTGDELTTYKDSIENKKAEMI